MNSLVLQIQIDFKRVVLRNLFFIFFSMIMPIGFYLLFTKVFDVGVPQEYMAQHYVNTLMQMTMYSVVLGSLFSFAMLLIEDRVQGVKESIRLTPFPEWKYVFSKICVQLLVNLLLIISVFIVGRVANDIKLSFIQWLGSGLWLLYAGLPIIGVGALISHCKNTNTASVVANIIQFPLAILSGLWMPIDSFSENIQKLAHFLPTYHGSLGAKEIVAGKLPGWESFFVILLYFVFFILVSIYTYTRSEGRR